MPTELGTLPDWCRQEWERLLKDPDPCAVTLRNIYDSKCHPLQRSNELLAMMHLAYEGAPRTIVEIGASRGGSVFIWPKLCFTATRIAAYEPNGFPYEDLFRQHFDTDFHFIHGSSLDPQNIDSLREWLNGDTIDVLFIDGCKTAFYQDFTNHLPLMSPGGIVFMHDITSTAREHWRLIEEDPQYRTARIIDTSESLQAVQRERRGEPATTDYDKWLRHWKGRGAGVGVVFLEKCQ